MLFNESSMAFGYQLSAEGEGEREREGEKRREG